MANLAALSQSPEALRGLFASLGLAFYPLLAESLQDQKINANTIHDLTGFDVLPERDQLRALEIIYAGSSAQNIYPYKSSSTPLPNARAFGKEERSVLVSRFRLAYVPGFKARLELKCSSLHIDATWVGPHVRKSVHISVPEGRNGAIMLGARAATTPWLAQQRRPQRALDAFRKMRQSTNTFTLLVRGLKVPDDAFDLPHAPERHYRLRLHELRTEGLWQLMLQTFDAQGAPVLLKRLVPQLAGPEVDVSFNLPASAHSMRAVLYAPNAGQARQMSFRTITLDVSETTHEDVALNAALASSWVLVLAKAGWSADHGGPEAAKSLARAGLGTVIWANFESGTDKTGSELDKTPFVCSEGVNFTALNPDETTQSWAGALARIKAMRPDRVIDLEGAVPAPLQTACAQAGIDLIALSEDRLVDYLVADLKK